MLTRKNRQGLRALADIAILDPGKSPSLNDLAERHGVSKAELESILGELSMHGILEKMPEKEPGYFLSKPATEIRIGQIFRALDHPVVSLEGQTCSMSEPCKDCVAPQSCGLRRSIAEVCDAITTQLDQTSLAELMPRSAEFAGIYPDQKTALSYFDA